MNEQEKEIIKLKGEDFTEIYNPWTTEKFQYNIDYFYYTLKNNNYLAKKTNNNAVIHLIKSSYQFKLDKIYKLEFTVNYKSGDYHIGFGDYNDMTKNAWFKNSNNKCVGLTNEGLFINGTNVNGGLKVENGKIYEFIINIKMKSFELKINKVEAGEFTFNFDNNNIYALAGMRNIGNSVSIKTFEKNN